MSNIISPYLFNEFNGIKYFDEPHEYFYDNKQFISVTTLNNKYVDPMDTNYWVNYKANEHNVLPHKIKIAWDFLKNKGTFKGSIVHDYIENLYLNKVFKYPTESVYSKFGFDPIKKEYNITKKQVDSFYKDSFNKLLPIKTEFVVYDIEAMIAGMIDMIFYNVKMQEYQLWDWKTNKSFSFKTNRRLLGELSLLDDSDMEIYSLQLSMYKYIIEKYLKIKLGKSYIVWFSHNNPTYKIIQTLDREYYVKLIIEDRLRELSSLN